MSAFCALGAQSKASEASTRRGRRHATAPFTIWVGSLASVPPHQAPWDTNTLSLVGKSCQEWREAHPTESPQSPGAWTRWWLFPRERAQMPASQEQGPGLLLDRPRALALTSSLQAHGSSAPRDRGHRLPAHRFRVALAITNLSSRRDPPSKPPDEAQPLGADGHFFCPIQTSRCPARPSRSCLPEFLSQRSRPFDGGQRAAGTIEVPARSVGPAHAEPC